jgi:hypothetical protein
MPFRIASYVVAALLVAGVAGIVVSLFTEIPWLLLAGGACLFLGTVVWGYVILRLRGRMRELEKEYEGRLREFAEKMKAEATEERPQDSEEGKPPS